MDEIDRDKKAYDLARAYLLQFSQEGITAALIEKYLHLSELKPRPGSIQGIYKRLLDSAQNANMKAGVIGGSIGGIERLGVVLCDFDPLAILRRYSTWEEVLDEISVVLKPRGKVRRESRSIWPHYCQTILSAAKFLSQFSNSDDFYVWVNFFDHDERARPVLPLFLDLEIDGIGFALACDFLKELGYINFGKPDVQIRDIFGGIGLCSPKASDYEIFKAIVRVAKNVGVTPYNVDKLFWLVGSGYFYDDKYIGTEGRIRTNKAQFIADAKKQLQL